MRKSCLDCARKHLGQAEVLMTEAKMGYPEHKWLAIGHIAEAESELLDSYPGIAKEIRRNRRGYMQDGDNFDTLQYIKILGEEKDEKDNVRQM